MTREGLNRALVDLGWLTLIQRVLGGKPSAAFALYQLMRAAGRPVTYRDFADGYIAHLDTGGSFRVGHRGRLTNNAQAIAKRIERVRSALADMGVTDAIRTCWPGGEGYVLDKCDLPRVEAALLYACGIELHELLA